MLDVSNKLNEDEINGLLERYKKLFDGLTVRKQKILAYRIVSELDKDNFDGLFDNISAIVKACDNNVNFFNLLVTYSMQKNCDEYKKLYKESLVAYKKILENYKLLAEELNLESSLELSHLFTYMLWNGYYSLNRTHCYMLQDRTLIPGLYSFDVLRGKGVCLAYAELLHNYLSVCDKKSSILECKFPTNKNEINFNYSPEIYRNMRNDFISKLLNKSMDVSMRGIINKLGNHAVNLIEEDNNLFIYDSTNLCVLNVDDCNNASIINGNGCFQLKPFSTMVLLPYCDPNFLFDRLLDDNIHSNLTRKDVIYSYEETIELIKDNLELLNDAYDNIHSELELINNQIKNNRSKNKLYKRKKN